jgi:hypothetical protein
VIERVEVDEKSLARLVTALRAESDSNALARDLVHGLERVAEPALAAARSALFGMASSSDVLPGLRSTVAAHTRVRVKLSGKHPGVSIRSDKTGMPRGFANAPKRLNSARGWRHQVFGNPTVWVTQRGAPGWFDGTIPRFQGAAQRAAEKAMDDMAKRIDARTKG